jgi:hypothetical protein
MKLVGYNEDSRLPLPPISHFFQTDSVVFVRVSPACATASGHDRLLFFLCSFLRDGVVAVRSLTL